MANWLTRTATALGLIKHDNGPPGPAGSSGIPITWPTNWFQRGWNVPPQTRGGSVVESCVQAYAQTLSILPGRHYQLDDDGTKTYVHGSRLNRVLAKPNEFQTRSDFMLNMVYSLLYTGNAYWVGNAVGSERPNAIYLLDPSVTQAHRIRETGDIFYSTSGDFLNMVDVTVNDRAMIPERFVGHIRLHTPTDPLVGVSPLQNAAQSVAAHGAITGGQAAFFENMSRPSGFISTDLDINKEQMQQLREAWEEQSKDLNAGGVPILASGMKWNAMTITSQDAQLVEAWKMTVEDISRVFRVPPMLINNLENSTFDNAETLMRFWLASGLGFLINHIELAFASYYGLDDRNEGVEYNQDLLLQADLQARMEALGTGVTKGLMAPNEGRKVLGYAPVDNGDMPLVQQQMVPVDQAGAGLQLAGTAPEPTPTPEPEDDTPISEAALSALVDFYMEGPNMRPEDIDVIAKIVAQQVKKGIEKAHDGLIGRIDALETENKALLDLLSGDLATADQLRAVTDTLGEHSASMDALKDGVCGVVDQLDTQLESINHLKAQDEARAQEATELTEQVAKAETRLAGLGTDAMSRIGQLDKAVEGVRDHIGSDLVDENIISRISKLERGRKDAKAVADRLDEVETKTSAYGPEIKAWFDQVEKQIASIEDKPVTKEDVFIALDEYQPEIIAKLEPVVEGAVFRAMPDPEQIDYVKVHDLVVEHINDRQDYFRGLPGDSAEVDYEEVAHLVEKMTKRHMPEMPKAQPPTDLQVQEAVRTLWPDIKAATLKYLPKMEHKGVYVPDTPYDIGDEVIKNGSTFRLMHPTDEAPPGAGWQMVAMRGKAGTGKPGKDGVGEKGDSIKGKDGIGIKDMVITDGKMMVVEMTDGEVKTFDLTEFIEVIIAAIGE